MTTEQFKILLQKWLDQQMTGQELEIFLTAAADPEYRLLLAGALDNDLVTGKFQGLSSQDQAQTALQHILAKKAEPLNTDLLSMHRVHFLRVTWLRYAAAVILLAGAGAYLYSIKAKKDVTASLAKHASAKTDILPGGNKAVLTLSDGTTILLDSVANGQLGLQGNVSIVKTANGQVIYKPGGSEQGEVMMNTMRTPKGGQYQVILPDGTRVWLNAASSLTYPAVFADKERRVKISGEAYFEVAENKQKPFIADVDGKLAIQVLGTSFNINAYANENKLRTTLLEGSVKVICQTWPAEPISLKRQLGAVILKPGEQAAIDAAYDRQPQGGQVFQKNSHADITRIMAWKNGLFSLENSSLQEVMRQLERWYDITVRYDGNIPEVEFKGEMDRGVRLSDFVIYMKELGINSRIEGRTLIIMGK